MMPSLYTYIVGFVLSLLCTLAAFSAAYLHVSSGHSFPAHELILPVLAILALAQLVVQLVFFLHFGKKSGAWNKVAFAFALFVAILVIGGSLWIMNNLKYSHQHGTIPQEVSTETRYE